MGRACDATVASRTWASTGRSPSGSSSLWRPAPMRLELPAARMMAAIEVGLDMWPVTFQIFFVYSFNKETDCSSCYNNASGTPPVLRLILTHILQSDTIKDEH